jgi:hypothetical protein
MVAPRDAGRRLLLSLASEAVSTVKPQPTDRDTLN